MYFDGLKSDYWLTKNVILQHNVGDNKLHKRQKWKPGEVAKWYLSAGKSLASGSPLVELAALPQTPLRSQRSWKPLLETKKNWQKK